MNRKKKSYLPEKSRTLIGDRLLDLIFMMIAFGVVFLIAGAVLGLQLEDPNPPIQYYAAGAAATLPILWRLLQRAKEKKTGILLAVVWAAAVIAAGALIAAD